MCVCVCMCVWCWRCLAEKLKCTSSPWFSWIHLDLHNYTTLSHIHTHAHIYIHTHVIVKSRCEYNIAVISQVRGTAEDVEITAILYEHARDLTGFYPVHWWRQKVAKQLDLATNPMSMLERSIPHGDDVKRLLSSLAQRPISIVRLN